MMRRTMILVAAFLMVTTMAHGQGLGQPQTSRTDKWEFSVQTRYSWSKDYDGEGGSSMKVQEDLGWGFGFAYNFNQHFNLGMLFTWRSVPFESEAVDVDDPNETHRYNGELSTSTIGVSGEYNILKGRFTPYVNGSLAWMHVNTNVFAGWTTGCWWDPWWGYICGPVPLTYGLNTGAYTLGIGGRFELSDKVYLRGGYEKGWVSSGAIDSVDMMRIDIGFLF